MLPFSNHFCGENSSQKHLFRTINSELSIKSDIPIVLIILYTAGVAVLLTIITYFSSPILTKIFGDGSLEVEKT